MARLGLAFRAFFRILRDAAFCRKVEEALAAAPAESEVLGVPARPELGPPLPAPRQEGQPRARAAEPPRGVPNPALVLLAALQRESRLIDFLKEPLGEYTDAQIGAAVRDVHRDAAAALDRWFGLKPVLEQPEGSSVEVPPGYATEEYRLTGRVSGAPPYRGTLQHHGWRATRCEVPAWTGTAEAAYVIAPAEVEL